MDKHHGEIKMGNIKKHYFHYGDKVEVTDGFYKGQVGTIKAHTETCTHSFMGFILGRYKTEYLVSYGFMSAEWVEAKHLDKVKPNRRHGRPKGAKNKRR